VVPVPSTARTVRVCVPADGIRQCQDHSTQVCAESGGVTVARDHVLPPSVLTSTAFIPRIPAKAMPCNVVPDR